ncbi:MAG TPA: DUF1080 domain-containing protein [Thermoguttaceae bacterium]|nr:DUF1080 domain-containing protein [Thermoguttaceae bacterium]
MNRTSSIVGVFLALAFVVGPALSQAQAADDDGFQELFNGKDLTGWQNASGGEPGGGWVVEDGAMVRKDRAGDVWTKARFGDFVLDLEFKTQGNSGVFIRTDNPRDCVQTGIEIQVDRPGSTPNRHSCGALYDLVAPSKEMSQADQWNRMVVTAKDNKITVAINGEPIAEMDLDLWTTPRQNPDGSGNKFGRALKDFKREGHVGLQDHGAAVSYRNIKIKPQ